MKKKAMNGKPGTVVSKGIGLSDEHPKKRTLLYIKLLNIIPLRCKDPEKKTTTAVAIMFLLVHLHDMESIDVEMSMKFMIIKLLTDYIDEDHDQENMANLLGQSVVKCLVVIAYLML